MGTKATHQLRGKQLHPVKAPAPPPTPPAKPAERELAGS